MILPGEVNWVADRAGRETFFFWLHIGAWIVFLNNEILLPFQNVTLKKINQCFITGPQPEMCWSRQLWNTGDRERNPTLQFSKHFLHPGWMLGRSGKAFLFLSFISLTGLPEGFSTSLVSTSKFCGSSFKRCLESAHFSPSTGTILAQAAIPCHLAHGTSLLSTSTLQSILHMALLLPPTIHLHMLGSNLLATLLFLRLTKHFLPQGLCTCTAWNTIPQDIHLGVPSPPTDLCSNVSS